MFNLRPIPLGSLAEVEPVFIVGAARSGTTPLQLALNRNPEIGVYGETQAFFVRRKFGADVTEAGSWRRLEFWRLVLASCSPYTDLLDREEIQQRLAHASSYAQLLDLVMGAIATREGKSRWGEKTPAHIFRLNEIRTCFPKARIVHIVRDPRAVVCSNIKAFTHSQFNDWNVYSFAKYWVRCLRVHGREIAARNDRYLLVRYEDFVTRPQSTLEEICSFLGVPFAEDMMRAHLAASDYVRPGRSGKIPPMHALTERPLDSTRTDAWKTILSAEQSKLVEQIAGKQMMAMGYAPARKEYVPPQMRVSRFSPRWALFEGSRIAMKNIKVPYWALRRALDSERAAPKQAGTSI